MTPTTRNMVRLFYTLLLITGLAIYVIWGTLYGTWTDIGLYSITIIPVLLGIIGIILYSKDREEFHLETDEELE